MAEKKRASGLGRGLSALLEDVAATADTPVNAGGTPGVLRIAIADIRANPGQPRRRFDPVAMDELIASVKAHGILQPILLRPAAGAYQIVAGERRWRAAQAAGLHEMPAVVRALDDQEVQEIALIENIQRSDLNAIEEARGYRRLIDDFGHTQAALAEIVGKSRSHVANLMRLLDLSPEVQALVEEGQLSMGHARALVGVPDAVALARKAVAEGLSVRAIERLAAGRPASSAKPVVLRPDSVTGSAADPNTEALELQLSETLGMPVALTVAAGASSGSLTIRFDSLDQLDWLCGKLGG